MSEVLARIKVRETHGIRRFLYPLTAIINLPVGTDTYWLGLFSSPDRQAVPSQVTLVSGRNDYPHRLDFAISLDPFSERELILESGTEQTLIDDPLHFGTPQEGNLQRSIQKRFAIGLDWNANICDVTYEGIAHLRGPSTISRNNFVRTRLDFQDLTGDDLIGAWVEEEGQYGDSQALTRVELTACKSWATITHTLDQPKAGDEVVFTLPLAVTSPILTCDFGVGGGIYGKLQAGVVEEIVWRSEFAGDEVRWSITTAGRVDYVGKVKTAEAFLPQRWFHVIDLDKALAVAITAIPEECWEMTITLQCTGYVQIAFRLGENAENCEYAIFGACYHFLNDVPAIAAATNPQSILLPPLVEVLPV